MLAWLSPILSFLGGPIVKGAVEAYQSKLAAGNTAERIEADLALRELEVQQKELELRNQLKIAEIGKWYEPDHLFGYIMVGYFFTIAIWDSVLQDWTHHSTPALKGDAGLWAGWIMAFYVGLRGSQNLARIIKR